MRIPDSTPIANLSCPDCGRKMPEKAFKADTVAIDIRGDIPSEIAGYQIVDQIARGASGVVYRALDPQGRTLALKVLVADGKPDREAIARFQREAEATTKLDHPNIVKVFDAGLAGRRHFIAMEYVEGHSLRELIAKDEVDLKSAVAHLRDITKALSHAHSRGVVHRDLKPENILITSAGVPKLSDFGIAKLTGKFSRLTATGIALGTPEYMSPEQAAGRSNEADARTDIYGIGVILYECAAGKLPFKGRSIIDTLKKIEQLQPPPLKGTVGGVDDRLDAVVLKAMAKDPDRRYQTASDLADDLDRWLKGEKVTAPVASRWSGIMDKLLGKKKR
jgi:serine/threonine protein kinase